MKNKYFLFLLVVVALSLFISYMPIGCSTEKGMSFASDDLAGIKKALADKNYTLEEINEDGKIFIRYARDNVFVWGLGEIPDKHASYGYFYRTDVITSEGMELCSWYIDGGYSIGTMYVQTTAEEVYSDLGGLKYFDYDWKYDKADKIYYYEDSTLKIENTRITITDSYMDNITLQQKETTLIFHTIGETDYDIPCYDD